MPHAEFLLGIDEVRVLDLVPVRLEEQGPLEIVLIGQAHSGDAPKGVTLDHSVVLARILFCRRRSSGFGGGGGFGCRRFGRGRRSGRLGSRGRRGGGNDLSW